MEDDKDSALVNQANMLMDSVRTGVYQQSILSNSQSSFLGKDVLDVGAGSGILSFFSAQAGAKVVYACEASDIANKLQLVNHSYKLIEQQLIVISKIVDEANNGGRNSFLRNKIKVLKGLCLTLFLDCDKLVKIIMLAKIEDTQIPSKVDTIVSEPIGVLLVHERMIESFIEARNKFLKPGGSMFPSSGTIELAPFTDDALYNETIQKASFFQQNNFLGVDLTVLQESAIDESFSQPVVGMFPPNQLIAQNSNPHVIDFYTCSMEDLHSFSIPFSWKVTKTSLCHGIAGWFDLEFKSTQVQTMDMYLSTGPNAPRTHWQATRLLFKEPLAVNSGETIKGVLNFKVNDQRSYDLDGHIEIENSKKQYIKSNPYHKSNPYLRIGSWRLHDQTYNYNYSNVYQIQPNEMYGENVY